MKGWYVALLTMGLSLAPLAPSLALEPARSHHSKGTVRSVDLARGQITMVADQVYVLTLRSETMIVDEVGRPLRAVALQPGDVVREECVRGDDGQHVAKVIRLLRPAWMDTVSPEQ